jgi:hypothetical protein
MRTSLGGGSLTVNSSRGYIKVENATGPPWYDDTIGAIEYEKNGRSIAYEGGGVWEKYPSGAALKVSEPRIFVHNTSDGIRTVFVSIINVSGDLSSVGGEGAASVVVRLNRSGSPYIDSPSVPDNVIITVTSDYADAWERYFDEIIDPTTDTVVPGPGANEVTATISYDTLVVNAHVIEVSVS